MYRYTFSYILNLITTSTAGNILFVEYKEKDDEWIKAHSSVFMVTMWLRISKLKENMLAWFCIPTMSHCFQRVVKTDYLLLDSLKDWQMSLLEI